MKAAAGFISHSTITSIIHLSRRIRFEQTLVFVEIRDADGTAEDVDDADHNA